MTDFGDQLLNTLLNGAFPAVDTVVIGNDEMPGQWLLQSTKREFLWQKQQGYGLNGARLLFTGLQNVEFSFLARFWDPKDWAAFNNKYRSKYFSAAVVALGAQKGYALGITHPELNAIGVKSAVLKSTPVFTNNGRGLYSALVEFIEFRGPPQIAQESPDAALPNAGPPTPSSADNAVSETALHDNQLRGARG